LIVAVNPRQSQYPLADATGELDAMFYRFFRKIRRSARHWNTDATRSDRNAVIQRVVAAAAKESKENLHGEGEVRRTPTPPPGPSPLVAQLLGQEVDEAISSERIGQRAFEIWVRNGRPLGTASQDWQQAEAELRAERAKL
jgi:hypothetical protein